MGVVHPAPITWLGWDLEVIENTVDQLTRAEVAFLRFSGLNDAGLSPVWAAPVGARIAWFQGSSKNVLNLTRS
jgi:hypothetical protein